MRQEQKSYQSGVIQYSLPVQRVFGLAQEEADRAGQAYIGPEHLLLGLMHDPEQMVSSALQRMKIDTDALRKDLRDRMLHAEPVVHNGLQLTPRAQRVLGLAYIEARRVHRHSVGPEHLLLGLLREREGLAARRLAHWGVTLDRARKVVHGSATEPRRTVADQQQLDDLQEQLKRRRSFWQRPAHAIEGLFIGIIAFAILFLLKGLQISDYSMAWSALCTLVGTGVLWQFVLRPGGSEDERKIGRELVNIADKRAVGLLIEIWSWPDPDISRAAYQELRKLLPQLRSEDARLLDAHQRQKLYKTLNDGNVDHAPEFVIMVLQALEHIGDIHSLPALDYLANLPGETSNRQRVRAAALACGAVVAERLERERSGETLLRPISRSAPKASEEALLRPTKAPSDAKPEELLRPPENRI